MGLDDDGAGALEEHGEQGAAGDAVALDAAYLVLQRLVEGEDVLGGDADRVALELDRVQVGGVVGEENLALAGAAHQLHLLAGGVADDAAGESGALVAEFDLALVQHHAALLGEHRLAAGLGEVGADQLGVLLRPALAGRRLAVLLQRDGEPGGRLPELGLREGGGAGCPNCGCWPNCGCCPDGCWPNCGCP